MASLSNTPAGMAWLKNFDEADRKVATKLVDALMLVSANEFDSKIVRMLSEIEGDARVNKERIALYSEREMTANEYDEVPSFFPETECGRATGAGIQPVVANPARQSIGSEGIVATLISKFCAAHRDTALSHPGPDELRDQRARKIILVTDFIGSGRRIARMLDAFWKVASIRSWASYKLIAFEVVCYSATDWGQSTVKLHPTKPKVRTFAACPTLRESFRGPELREIEQLCTKYPKKSRDWMGFGGMGSLIAFSHGIPNNAPQIFHSSRGGWRPLFVGRSTQMTDLNAVADTAEEIANRSQALLRVRNAQHVLSTVHGEEWALTMMVLLTVRGGARSPMIVSARTHLSVGSVTKVLNLAVLAGWLSPNMRLTAMGRRELRSLLRWGEDVTELAFPHSDLYFPKQLRAP